MLQIKLLISDIQVWNHLCMIGVNDLLQAASKRRMIHEQEKQAVKDFPPLLIVGLTIFSVVATVIVGIDWFLKIIPPALVPIILIITATLNYLWHDKRTNRHKWLRRLLFGLIITMLSLNIWKTIRDDVTTKAHEAAVANEAAKKQRDKATQLLGQIYAELTWNSATLQKKQGGAWMPPQDPKRFEMVLNFIKADKFSSMVPKISGSELSILQEYGPSGQDAYHKIIAAYGSLELIEKDEALVFEKIEKANQQSERIKWLKSLDDLYGDARSSIGAAARATHKLYDELRIQEK